MDQKARYVQISDVLSKLTRDEDFYEKFRDPKGFEIEVDGEKIQIGPWQESEVDWERVYFWREKEDDTFVVYMGTDEWDSWGTHYGNYGNNFYVAEIVEWTPVLKSIWM